MKQSNSYHQECVIQLGQETLEKSLEEARKMLTQVRQQHGMPDDHEKRQRSTTYNPLRFRSSSSVVAPFKLGELVAVHAQRSWKRVKIRNKGLEVHSKVKLGHNYVRKMGAEPREHNVVDVRMRHGFINREQED